MSVGHLHSIHHGDGKYTHLFNLQFMNVAEIEVLQNLLSGRPIPKERMQASNSLKKSVDEIINMAIVKEKQPASENTDHDIIKEVEGVIDPPQEPQ